MSLDFAEFAEKYFGEDLILPSWQKQFLQLPLTTDWFILAPPPQRGVSLWNQAGWLAVASLDMPGRVVGLTWYYFPFPLRKG